MILTSRSPRIISLIASATEIIYGLGLLEYEVGRSHECDFPPDVTLLPVCTAPKFRTDGTSYEIDQRVKAILEQALSVYRVDVEMLERLQPTHIITQSQCEVCAVSFRDVEEAACSAITSHPQIISLQPDRLSDIRDDITRVAQALGCPERASTLIADMDRRLKAIREAASGSGNTRPRVLFVEWIEPLMTGGNWMPELIDIAGGNNLFGETGKHSPPLDWQDVVAADPEIIVVAPCGFDIDRALSDMNVLVRNAEWSRLSAVKKGRVYIADGNQYFNRPGPRIVDSTEILAEMFHQSTFRFGHKGIGWIPFTLAVP